MKNEFGRGVIYTVTNYIWWFFLGNFFFLILNVPLLIVLFLFRTSKFGDYGGLVFLTGVLIAPAFCALLSVMGKLKREKDIDITKDFFKAYKRNFIQSLFLGTLESICLFIVYVDIFNYKYSYNSQIVLGVFLLIGLMVLCIGLFAFPIISRFYLPIKDVFKLSIKYMLKKPMVTILNILVLFAMVLLFNYMPSIIILFFVSIICYLIMSNELEILKEIEEMYKNKITRI